MKASCPEYPDLWRRFKQHGSQDARRELIENHRHFVFMSLERFIFPQHMSKQDLESEGFIGLVRAVDRFQPARRVRFASFAITQIRFAFTEYLRSQDWAPRSVREKQRRLNAAWRACRRPDRTLDPVEAARFLGLDLDAYEELCREARPLETCSISEELSGAGIEATENAAWGLLSVAGTLGYLPDFVTPLAAAAEKAALWREIEALPQAWAYTFRRFYQDGLTLKAIAAELHRSEGSINQYVAQGRARLRQWLAGNDLFEAAR